METRDWLHSADTVTVISQCLQATVHCVVMCWNIIHYYLFVYHS